MNNLIKKSNAVGISFSDRSIDFLYLENKSYPRKISIKLPPAVYVSGEVVNKKILFKSLKKGWHKINCSKKTRIAISLPSNQVYIQSFRLPAELEGASLKEKIIEKVKEKTSLNFKKIIWDYVATKDGGEKMIVFSAAKKELVDFYKNLFAKAKLNLEIIDIQPLALSRSLLYPVKNKACDIILEMDWDQSSAYVFNERGFMINFATLPVSGKQLATAIKEKLKISLIEAEKIKQVEGLISNDNPGFTALAAKVKTIAKSIASLIAEVESFSGEKLNKVILAGDDSLIPRLSEFLKKEINRQVEIGQPLPRLGLMHTNRIENVVLANAAGLALLGENKALPHINLLGKPVIVQDIVKKTETIAGLKVRIKIFIFLFVFIIILLFLFLSNSSVSKELPNEKQVTRLR